MAKNKFEFYTKDEIKKILLRADRLLYVDNGIDEIVIKYWNLPDFIVDMSHIMKQDCNLKVYKYPAISMTPIVTTNGEFLDKCDPRVREDIIAILNALQMTKETRDYKVISEKDLNDALDEIINKTDVKINHLWLSDYGDIRCNATIYIHGKPKANIIASFDREIHPDWKNSQNEYKEDIKNNIEEYLYMPKLSKCSKLLQEIYDNVCQSDATMCHITEEDWQNDYASKYSCIDIETLQKEVKKYNLEDVITFNEQEYKIIAWGDLETRFNDNRAFVREKIHER